jgi:hypothetical protein
VVYADARVERKWWRRNSSDSEISVVTNLLPWFLNLRIKR